MRCRWETWLPALCRVLATRIIPRERCLTLLSLLYLLTVIIFKTFDLLGGFEMTHRELWQMVVEATKLEDKWVIEVSDDVARFVACKFTVPGVNLYC